MSVAVGVPTAVALGDTEVAPVLSSPQAAAYDAFAAAVCVLDANRVAIGARGADGQGQGAGCVEVFAFADGAWTFEARPVATGLAAGDQLGEALAGNGEWLAAGATRHDASGSDAGAVWVFRREAGGWSGVQKLVPPAGNAGARFGSSLAMDGSTLVVGAPRAQGGGFVAVYRRNPAGQWLLESTIPNPTPSPGNRFGEDVALRGDLLAVGDPSDDAVANDAGSVTLFRRVDSAWIPSGVLASDPVEAQAYFGQSVSIGSTASGAARIAVGAYGADVAAGTGAAIADAGRVDLFEVAEGGWQRVASLTPDDPRAGMNFGWDIAIEGDAILVGAPAASAMPGGGSGVPFAGRAFVYLRSGTGLWNTAVTLSKQVPASNELFGTSVSLRSGRAALGAPGALQVGTPVGAAAAIAGLADCDGDGVLDLLEIAQGAPDCDSDGRLDACEPDTDDDGVPDECDGCPLDAELQEAFPLWADLDGDGFGASAAEIASCVSVPGYVANGEDCDDTRVLYADADGDGYGSGPPAACGAKLYGDCDDTESGIYPGAVELCATVGTDDDCDGATGDVDGAAADRVPYFADADNDTFTLSTGALFCPGTVNAGFRPARSKLLDCNDANPQAYPDAPELCATVGTDNDCDGLSGDVDGAASDRVQYYADADNDTFTLSTGALFCPGTANAGFRPAPSSPLDCNDANAQAYPGAPELCATVGTDNDCDGATADVDGAASDRVQYYADADNDTFTLSTGALFCPGTANAGFRPAPSSPLDCNDANAQAYPGAPELCATVGTDNDCDGNAQEASDTSTFYADADGDGAGDSGSTVQACAAPPGFVAVAGDGCPSDGAKTDPGVCGCGFADADVDGDGSVDCVSFEPQEWPVSAGGNGHYYRVFAQALTLPQAVEFAEARGATLATITTAQEQSFVAALDGVDAFDCAGPRIGLVQQPGLSDPLAGWSWVTGEAYTLVNWAPGEPNDYQGVDETSATLYCSPLRKWNDVPATARLALVVEWSADCDGDGRTDFGEILRGEEPDSDDNGVPDACEGAYEVPGVYPTIQAAIDAVPPGQRHTVTVAPGVRNESFSLNGKDVLVLGAEDGTTVIDGAGMSVSVVRFTGGEPVTAGIERLVIRNGTAGTVINPPAPVLVGGGLFGEFTSATVRECRFEDCSSEYGAGAYIYKGTVSFIGCTFSSNDALEEGGGLFLYNCDGAVSGCTFTSNRASLASAGAGTALRTVGARTAGASILVSGCTMTGNSANVEASAIDHFEDAAGVPGVLRLEGCTVSGNTSPNRAGGLGVFGRQSSCVLAGATSICSNTQKNVDGPYLIDGSAEVCDCEADFLGDGQVNAADLGVVLGSWGLTSAQGTGDLTHDGLVNAGDLARLLSAWGTCR